MAGREMPVRVPRERGFDIAADVRDKPASGAETTARRRVQRRGQLIGDEDLGRAGQCHHDHPRCRMPAHRHSVSATSLPHDQRKRHKPHVTAALPERRPGTLVCAGSRVAWVLPGSTPEPVHARPLGDTDDEPGALLPILEDVTDATFGLPSPDDRGDATRARLLRDALRLSFRNIAGPFRSFASLAVSHRKCQLVPLIMSAAQDTTLAADRDAR
jgi:hypothetical protein